MSTNWKGVWVAIVTPFGNGKVDNEALERLTDRLLADGVHGLVPCGTTGEGSSLTDAEFTTVVETVLGRVKGKIPIVPGTGSNNTEKTIERTILAKQAGAQGALVVTPYYVRPTQDGLRRHYGAVSAKVDLPLLLYNVPSRTAVNLLPETVEKLLGEAQVGGIKDCAPLPQISELIGRVGEKISVLSGEDGVFLPFLSIGGRGIISVVANILPKNFVEIYEAFERRDLDRARTEFQKVGRLIETLFIEPNPVPLKAALALMGLCRGDLRCPLTDISEKNHHALKAVLASMNLVRP
ncbi:MAG: 4-hydroxy-tetrahydrodipicolinate synthase [Pseudomonadota bacterium]